MTEISIVVPCYFTGKRVLVLCEGLKQALSNLDYEIVLVNDGSIDDTWEMIQRACEIDCRVRGINLAKNFGQHNALLAGITHASGDYLVTMDDDLQHAPNDVERLHAYIVEQELDLIYAIPREEQHGVLRDFFSIQAKRFFERLLDVAHASKTSAFRIFSRSIVGSFRAYTGRHVDIDALLLWGTSRVGTLEVDHHPREEGMSNYGFFGLVSYAVKLIVSNSTVPLKFVGYLGLLFTLFGAATLLYVLYAYFASDSQLPGFTFTISVVVLFSGTIMFSLGIIGQYLAHMYYRQMGYPYAVVRETIGIEQPPDES